MENPTTAQVRSYLVESNGWSDQEVDQLFGYYWRAINPDGTTNLDRLQWTFLASGF